MLHFFPFSVHDSKWGVCAANRRQFICGVEQTTGLRGNGGTRNNKHNLQIQRHSHGEGPIVYKAMPMAAQSWH